MHISVVKKLDERKDADALILPFWREKKKAHPAFAKNPFAALLAFPLHSGDFQAKEGETLFLYGDKSNEKRIILLGLGEKKSCTAEKLRRSYAALLKVCLRKKLTNLNLLLPSDGPLKSDRQCQVIYEGISLANYAFDSLKSASIKDEPPVLLRKLCFIGGDAKGLALCHKSETIISSVYFARDLINGNADDVTPQALAKVAKELQKEYPAIKTTLFDKKQIEKLGMGLLLAVARGAARDPAFIVMEYQGAPKSKEKTAIVGKGITYDTGGLNLKPGSSMETMKDDMSGGAAVLGTLRAAAALKLKVNLIGVIPSTENAIGSRSYKPGDVYTSHSGKTVEINDTDAEGRLVLADALSYVQEKLHPTRIIDLATLTGAIVVALGEGITGLFSNNDALANALTEAGERTDERVWRMPIMADYKDTLKSSIADMKNSGGRKGGSIIAALFLQEFIKGGIPWAHLDIAGTAFITEPKHYNPTAATGVGVRLLIDFLENQG